MRAIYKNIKSAKDIEIEETLAGIDITNAVCDRLDRMVTDEFLACMTEDLNKAFSSNNLGVVFTLLRKNFVFVNVEVVNDFHLLDGIKINDDIQETLKEIIEYQILCDTESIANNNIVLDRIFQSDNLGEIFIRIQQENIEIDLNTINWVNLLDGSEITDSIRNAVQELVNTHHDAQAGWINQMSPESQVDSLIKGLGIPGPKIREALITCEHEPDPEM